MGESLGLESITEIGSYDVSVDGNGDDKIGGSALGESL